MGDRDSKGRFVKGRISSDEESLKRAIALENSWKSRDNYIGDIKNKYPYIYNIWRGIRFTDKGKGVGNCPEWDNFRNFYNDVSPTYKKGLLFRRLNISDNYNPKNFIWVTSEEAILLKSNLVYLEYNDEKYTLKQLADKFNVSLNGIKIRYHRREKFNYTVEEIIFGRKKNRNSKSIRDYKVSNMTPRQKASKMISSYKLKDKLQTPYSVCDIDIDWMINNIFKKECVYCGDTNRLGCDRIDNNIGHIKSNVVPCCYECNCARNNNFSFEEMKEIGKTIAKVKAHRKNIQNEAV